MVSSFSVLLFVAAATEFTLKTSDCPDSDVPVQVVDTDRGRLWYKKDNKFKIPKGEGGPAGEHMSNISNLTTTQQNI